MKIDNEMFFTVIECYFSYCSPLDDIIELNTTTNAGYGMFVTLNRNSKRSFFEQFSDYVKNFNVDEEMKKHYYYYNVTNDVATKNDLTAFKVQLERILDELKSMYVFDDVTCDEYGKWSQVCISCKEKLGIDESLLDDVGRGICGVKGCSNESDFYIDFK